MRSNTRIIALVASIVLALVLLSVLPCAEKACAQAPCTQASRSMQASTINSNLGSLRNNITTTISDAQWTLTGLQGDVGLLISKRPMTNVERQHMMDRVTKANKYISQWTDEKKNMMNTLSSLESTIDCSAMSQADKIKAHGKVNQLRALTNQMDPVASQMKSTLSMIDKYK